MISAADVQLVGCPLEAAVVASTESMRSCVAISCNIDRERRAVSEDMREGAAPRAAVAVMKLARLDQDAFKSAALCIPCPWIYGRNQQRAGKSGQSAPLFAFCLRTSRSFGLVRRRFGFTTFGILALIRTDARSAAFTPVSTLMDQCQRSAPGVTRTRGQQFRKLLLYPPELRGRNHLYDNDLRAACNRRWSCNWFGMGPTSNVARPLS